MADVGSGRLRRWGGAVLVCALFIAVVSWLWFAPLTGDPQTRAKITAVATVAAALAALGSTVAAFASLTSARESTEIARQARRAMVVHNRPSGWYRSLCKYDDPEYLGPDAVVDGDSLRSFADDEVKNWIELKCLSGVKSVQFSYVTPAGQHPPVAVTPREPQTLPGVHPIATTPGQFTGITPVNVSRWTLTCRDQETSSLWRASGVTESGNLFHDDMVREVEFALVDSHLAKPRDRKRTVP